MLSVVVVRCRFHGDGSFSAAVHDLAGSRPAFLVVAQVEGFLDAVCEELDPTISA